MAAEYCASDWGRHAHIVAVGREAIGAGKVAEAHAAEGREDVCFCVIHPGSSGMAGEYWTLRVFKHDHGPNTDILEKKIERLWMATGTSPSDYSTPSPPPDSFQKKRREHAAAEAFGLGAVLGGEDGNVELDAWPCLGATAFSSRKTGVDAGGVAGRPRHRARVGWPVPAACVDTHLWCRLPRALIGWPYRPRPVAAEWEDYSSRRENDLGLLETEGYEASDDLFFTSSDTYCRGTLTKIEGETHVKDMIMENDKSKMADLHLFKAIQRTPFSPLKTDNVEVIAGSSQQEDNIDYNPEMIGVADDQHSISSGDKDHEQEKVDYVEKLNEMKRQREDPMTHCEGDTDIDDLYTPEDADVDLGVADMDDMSCELSDPPSENGGLSTLECDTDEENKPPPGKRRRGKGIQVQRTYFDESNMMDTSQLCKGMCFTDAGQFRKALKSYHIVKGRDYKYTRNKADRIKVKCSQDKVKCDFFTSWERENIHGIDGCFVKLTNGAQVLVASAREGNNNMFPIAFAVVGKEDT
ncbi:hypothetical protein OsI_30707 [Oryza sativa Indica Group]|uniref:Uncharacterized protein n=1 Tax=Oryza sativa subsp. indica TaxID=39946 RepID=A2YZD0_ORYSI|nr:hypothetical protein OsI_30707 [Oryza sativa Indica Group]